MKQALFLVTLIVLFESVGGILGMLTAPEIGTWYEGLVKSPLNPPDQAFGIVWPVLYAMLAIAFWMILRQPQSVERKNILILFSAHMILNWAWTPVFFTAHHLLGGLVILVLIVITALILFAMLWRFERRAALLLIPYIGWVSFATHLNQYIWQNNP